MNLFLRKNVFRTFDFVENPIIEKMKKQKNYFKNTLFSVAIVFKKY